MESLLVRRASASDADAIAALLIERNDLRASREYMAAYLADPKPAEAAFVAAVGQQVVGMACLRIIPQLCDPAPYAELTELLVAEAHRRSGVGRALIQHIEAEALASGAQELVLMTAWHNSRAHSFYYAMGYSLYTVMMRRMLKSIV